MPPLRPLSGLASLTRTFPVPRVAPSSHLPFLAAITTHPASNARSFSASPPHASAAGGHESAYDPPSGWLFGVKPGEKYQNEGWERIFVWGFWGSLAVTAVAYAYKPDSSIQTWALEEARRRLEAEGILADPTSAGDPSKAN